MNQAALDKVQWDKFWDYWQDLIEEFPAAKTEALVTAGRAVLPVLQAQIDRRVDDKRGRVKRWQDIRRGSQGGYVAISPVSYEISVNKTKNRFVTARDITKYLERGHAVRPPSGRSKRYVPRADKSYVPGRMFYSWTKLDAAKIAIRAADEAMERLCNALDDFNYG